MKLHRFSYIKVIKLIFLFEIYIAKLSLTNFLFYFKLFRVKDNKRISIEVSFFF